MIGLWLLLLQSVAAPAPAPEFLRIPPGVFQDLSFTNPFWMNRTEVTVGQFGDFVRVTGYRTTTRFRSAWNTSTTISVSDVCAPLLAW